MTSRRNPRRLLNNKWQIDNEKNVKCLFAYS